MKRIIIVSLLLIAIIGKAQIGDLSFLSSPNQQIIQMVVKGSFAKTTTSYRLQNKETKKIFTKAGENEFSKIESFSVRTKNGMIFTNKAVKPWEYDFDFKKYEQDNIPIPYKITIETKTESQTYDFEDINTSVCSEDGSFYFSNDKYFDQDGWTTDFSSGTKDGWLVWLVQEKNDSLSYLIIKKQIDFKENVFDYNIDKPNTTKKVIAGIFVSPYHTSIGSIEFALNGIVLIKGNKYSIIKPNISMDRKIDLEEVETPDSNEGEISASKEEAKNKDGEKEKNKDKKKKRK